MAVDKLTEALKALIPKLTRWDCVSFGILLVIGWVALEGFKALSASLEELLILLVIVFAFAVILWILEPALKRLWIKKR